MSTITSIFALHIPKSFEVLYLVDIPDEVEKEDRYLHKIPLVTRKWYKEDLPMREEWLQIVAVVKEMERLTYLQKQISENKWGKWSAFSSVEFRVCI